MRPCYRLAAGAAFLLALSFTGYAQISAVLELEQREWEKKIAPAAQPNMMMMQMPRRNALQETDPAFFKTEDALRVGDQVLAYQRVTGGWPKNTDMAARMTDAELARVRAEKSRTDDSTIDNNATTSQMVYLAAISGISPSMTMRSSTRWHSSARSIPSRNLMATA